MKYNIAIVITTYNRVRKLDETLNKLINFKYSYGEIKIIVVNDGSNDGTKELIDSKYPQVFQIIGDGNYFFTKSLNMGLKYALSSNYDAVVTLNDDCNLDSKYFDNCYKLLTKSTNVIYAPITVDPFNQIVLDAGYKVKWFPFYKLIPLHRDELLDHIPDEYSIDTIGGRGLLIPIPVIKNIGLYDERRLKQYGSDDDFLFRAKKKGFSVLINKSLVLYDIFNEVFFAKNIIKNYQGLLSKKSKQNIFNMLILIIRHCPRLLLPLTLSLSILAKIVLPLIKNKQMRDKALDIFVMSLMVINSGFQYFYVNEEWIVVSLVGVFFILALKNFRGIKFSNRYFFIFFVFVLWEFTQFLILGGFRPRSLLGTGARLLLAILVISYLNTRFPIVYIRFVNIFAFISVILYVVLFVPGSYDILMELSDNFKPFFPTEFIGYEYNPNIVIFNLHGYEFTPRRNSGPFWEPGSFAVFLTIALIMQIIIDNRFNLRKNLILLIAIVTTFSTTGYLVTMLILLSTFLVNTKSKFTNLIIVLLFIYPFFWLLTNLDFLLPKISDNIKLAPQTTGSRFGSALADIRLLKNNPLLGYGRNIEATYGISFFVKKEMHRNNGLTKLFVQWGLLGIVFLYLTFKGTQGVSIFFTKNIYYSYILMAVIILNGFSQSIFQYTFFMGLMFWHVVYKNKLKKTSTINQSGNEKYLY